MTIFDNTYASRKSLLAAAKKANVDVSAFDVHENDGRFALATKAIAKPVSFVWAYLADHANVDRKANRASLLAMGLNKNMVNTQTSRFYKTGGDKAAWLEIEKASRKSA